MDEVYLNGKFVGSVENARDFVDTLLSERRKNKLCSYSSSL